MDKLAAGVRSPGSEKEGEKTARERSVRSARDGSPGVKFPKTMSRLPPSSPTSKLCSYDHLIEFPEVNVFSTILQKSKEIPKMCTIIVSFYQVLQDAIKFRGDEMRLLYLFCSCSYIVVWSWLRRVDYLQKLKVLGCIDAKICK